jgi:sugar phosphate isomerase/epimerase
MMATEADGSPESALTNERSRREAADSHSVMHHLRLAVATRCLNQPLRSSLRASAAFGAKGIQFDVRDELRAVELGETGRRQLIHQVEELGLRVAATTFPTRRGFADQEQLDARVAATRAAMEFTRQMRASVLTLRLGKIPAEKESNDYRLLTDVVSDLARHGNQVGVTLAVTPTHDSPEALGGFLESIKTGPIGIDFDPAEFVLSGHAPEAAFRHLYRTIVHVTARDAIRDVGGGGVEVALGRGEVDWIELLPLLEESAYTGWATVARMGGNDRPGDIARGVEFLTNVGIS